MPTPDVIIPDPPVSPTGAAMLPQLVLKIGTPLAAIAGAVAAASVMGVDISFLPPVLVKVCAFISLCLAPALGIASQGARR